jgi:hypothetical protein
VRNYEFTEQAKAENAVFYLPLRKKTASLPRIFISSKTIAADEG